MLTYDEARTMMERAKGGRKKLENNTWLEERHAANLRCVRCNAPYDPADSRWTRADNSFNRFKHDCGDPVLPDYAVRLHQTDVVTLHPDDSYTLDSGGWRTVTTKDRINRYAPGTLGSDRGAWFYYPLPGQWDYRFPFADGMRVTAGRQVIGAGIDETPIRREIAKQVRAYIDGFAAHVARQGLADPGPGDCWGCSMTVKPEDAKKLAGSPWGQEKAVQPAADMPFGIDHIFSHFAEKYYVPSLVWRAVQRAGNPGMVYRMIQEQARRGKTDWLKGDLRAYFRKLMPALVAHKVAEREQGQGRGQGQGREVHHVA